MKKYLSFFFVFFLCLGCAKDTVRNNNPYIPNYPFSSNKLLNLNNIFLPPYKTIYFVYLDISSSTILLKQGKFSNVCFTLTKY